MADDKQLERLYDYTKFHIGIYLGSASGLIALISTISKSEQSSGFLGSLIGCPIAAVVSLFFMMLAGMSGAIVATSTIECESYKQFVDEKQGAYGFSPFIGKTWITIEHGSFWLSLVALAISILSANEVWTWVISDPKAC